MSWILRREDRALGYAETLTMTATPNVSSSKPTGTESVSGVQTLNREVVNAAGQVVDSRRYFDLTGVTYATTLSLGASGTNYYKTEAGYNKRGLVNRTVTPTGTIYRTEYDGLNRPISECIGRDDTPTTGFWSPTNLTGTDMVKIREYEYDGGGVGDGNLTSVTEIPSNSAANRVSELYYDWRNRLVAAKSGVEMSESTLLNRMIGYAEYDNLNEVIVSETYDGDAVTISDSNSDGVPDRPSSSLLRSKSTASYDEQGRVYRTDTYSVNPSSGSVSSDSLYSLVWYDRRGNVVKMSAPGGLVQKAKFDGVGRMTIGYTTDGGGDSSYSDAFTVTGDIVLEQVETTYDANSNAILVTTRSRFHDETDTGSLGDPANDPKARVSYSAAYYDAIDRSTATVNVGTNGGSSYTRSGSVPSRSDTVLVVSQTYNTSGWVEDVTDPRGIVTRTSYDDAGRVKQVVENYVNGTPSNDDDKTVQFTYDGMDHTLTLKALQTGGGYQETKWVYGVTTGQGSAITSNDVLRAVQHPDASTGAASSGEQELFTVNGVGQTLTATDRNGSVHTYTFDVLGRMTKDAVTTLGTGVDGAVRRIEIGYDTQGNAYLFTQYDAASSGNVVNQVKREFNGLGQMTREYQEHSGAVDGSTLYVGMTYSEMASSANHSRLTKITYPSGYELNPNYSSGLNSNISRLSILSDSTGTLESYDYLGLGSVVRRAHPQPGFDQTYIKQGMESNGDAGDQYTGLDRFGRVVDQRTLLTSNGTSLDRFQYGYDRDGNRLYRENLVNSAFSELYAYDGLNQLVSFDRGTLNGGKNGIDRRGNARPGLGDGCVGEFQQRDNGRHDSEPNAQRPERDRHGGEQLADV